MTNLSDIITTRSDRSQIVEYNNPLFECFAVKSYYAANKTYYVTEHWHEDVELLYIIDGELEYRVNGKSIILHAGEGFVLILSVSIQITLFLGSLALIIVALLTHPFYAVPNISNRLT